MSDTLRMHGNVYSSREGVKVTIPTAQPGNYDFAPSKGVVKDYVRECVRAALEEHMPGWLHSKTSVITIREADNRAPGSYVWAVYSG